MAKPLTPDALIYDLPQASDPQISPDGRRIAYVVSTNERATGKTTSHLWMCHREGDAARRLTYSGEHNGSPRWSPDGRWLAFVSDRSPRSGKQDADECKDRRTALFVMPVDTPGEARELTRHAGGIADLAWSPDGRAIAYVARFDPDNPNDEQPPSDAAPKVRVTRRIDYKRDGAGYLGDARNHVFAVDVASGQRRRISTDLHEHSRPVWSPDPSTSSGQARWLAAGRDDWATESSPVVLFEVESGGQRAVALESGGFSAWAWSSTGDRLILAGEPRPITGQPDLFIYHLADGSLRPLADDLPCLPAHGAQPVWLDDRRVLVHALQHGASGLYVLDTETGRLDQEQTWTAVHRGLSLDDARHYVVQAHASFEHSGEIAVFDRHSRTTHVITEYSAALLRDCPPAGWERLEVRRDPFTIEAWLLKPPGLDPATRYPVILDIHGGPQGEFGYDFSFVQQVLATHGFLVVLANPRGSTSYGREFARQVNLDWGGEDYLDLLTIMDEVLARPYADRKRTGIMGYSYGGYMTAWMLGQTDRFQACVCGAPVFDLESEYGTGDMDFIACDWEWGGPPHEQREFYASRSPATFAHRATTPTLIIQGEADERCPVGQAEQLFVALTKAGCEVELARYPGGSHGFPWHGPPAHRTDYLARTLAWFERHLARSPTRAPQSDPAR